MNYMINGEAASVAAESGIYAVLYGIFWIGMALLCAGSFKTLWIYALSRKRLRRRNKGKGRLAQLKILKKADLLVRATTGKEKCGAALLGLSLLLFGAAFYACYGKVSVQAALITGGMCGGFPWLILRLKLEKLRACGNEEGEWFMAELLGKYRISGFNMDLCLESIVSDRKKKSVCYDQCENVLSAMRKAGDREDLFACGEAFAFAIGSGWADMLSYNLGCAIAEGTNVCEGLSDVISQIREGKKLMEERKRLNSEAGRLVVFMVPFSYAVTLVFSSKFLGIGTSEFLHNQFGTAAGITLFFGILFTFFVNLLLISLVRVKPPDF